MPKTEAAGRLGGSAVSVLSSAVIVAGIALRLLRHAQGRDLWLDEVFLANNLLHKTPAELLGTLDYRQGAPPLFLLLCKLAVTLFGTSEHALRLVPLIMGVASVPLFHLLARRMLNPWGSLAALALFAVIEPLVYYASEIKQYSTDVAVGLAVMLTFARVVPHAATSAAVPGDQAHRRDGRGRRESGPRARLTQLAVVGGLALFLSHPSVFVVAGGAAWLLARRGLRRGVVMVFGVWALAFVADYFLFLRPLSANEGLQHHWAYGYPPYSPALGHWLYEAYLEVFRGYSTMWLWFESVEIWPARAAAALSVFGWAGLWLWRRRWAGLVTFPVLLTLLAAFLHKYPFDGRLILFLVPMFVLAVGAAVGWAAERGRVATVLASALLAVVLLPTAGRALEYALHPPGREEITPVLAYLKEQWRDGDVLYVYHAADAPYLYYRDRMGLPAVPFVHGRRETEEPGAFARDVEKVAGGARVWALFSHVWAPRGGGDEEAQLLEIFTERGRQVEAFRSVGASVHLFDLSQGRSEQAGNSAPSPGSRFSGRGR